MKTRNVVINTLLGFAFLFAIAFVGWEMVPSQAEAQSVNSGNIHYVNLNGTDNSAGYTVTADCRGTSTVDFVISSSGLGTSLLKTSGDGSKYLLTDTVSTNATVSRTTKTVPGAYVSMSSTTASVAFTGYIACK